MAQVEALARLGRVDEAIERVDRAVASAGDQAALRIAKARFLLRKGEVKAARSALVEGLDPGRATRKRRSARRSASSTRPRGTAPPLDWLSSTGPGSDPTRSTLAWRS